MTGKGFHRRAVLTGGVAGAGLLGASCSSLWPGAAACNREFETRMPLGEPLPPMRTLADPKGFNIGTVFSYDLLNPNDRRYSPQYAALVARECNMVVTQNDFKIHRMIDVTQSGSPRPAIRWAPTDRFVQHFRRRNIAVRGHTIIWNRHVDDLPFFETMSAEEIASFQDWYVETMMGRYRGRVASWDVVNEPAVPGGGAGENDGYRDGPYFAAYGEKYVAEAYKRARAADPQAQLVLNDFAFAWASPWAKRQRDNFLRILDRALDDGAPIDAVGFQSHLIMDDHLSQDAFMAYVEQIRARDVKILITEMDVEEPVSARSNEERDERLAAYVRDYLQPLMDDRIIDTIVWWGLSDLRTTQYAEAMSANSTSEFRPRPAPYDVDYRPKAMRVMMGDLIAAW